MHIRILNNTNPFLPWSRGWHQIILKISSSSEETEMNRRMDATSKLGKRNLKSLLVGTPEIRWPSVAYTA